MQRLSMQSIKKKLAEAAADANKSVKVNFKPAKPTATKEPSGDAKKLPAGAKGKGAPKLKQFSVKKAADSGPDKAPASQKIKGGNGSPSMKKASEPSMKVSGSKSKSPLASAEKFNMDLSKIDVKWSKPRVPTEAERNSLVGTGLMSDKTKAVSFKVSMPNIDYGIVAVDKKPIKVSQSPKFTEVKNVKLVKEGLVNGQVSIKLPNKTHTFDVITVSELRSICENFTNIGQPVTVTFKPFVRNMYLDRDVKKALAEAVHYNFNNLEKTYKNKLSESKPYVKKALVESYNDFFATDKKTFVSQSFKTIMKDGYDFYKSLYESHLKPYDVTVRATTQSGRESFKIVTKALSEGHAAYNAFNEVLAEAGVETKFESAFVGPKKFMFEEVQGILSKSLKFEIDTLDFNKAGQKNKVAAKFEPATPKHEKLTLKTPSIKGVEKVGNFSKGGDIDTKTRSSMGKDNRSKTLKQYLGGPAKDKGIQYADNPLTEGQLPRSDMAKDFIIDYFADDFKDLATHLKMEYELLYDLGDGAFGCAVYDSTGNNGFGVKTNAKPTPDRGWELRRITVKYRVDGKDYTKAFGANDIDGVYKYLSDIVGQYAASKNLKLPEFA